MTLKLNTVGIQRLSKYIFMQNSTYADRAVRVQALRVSAY